MTDDDELTSWREMLDEARAECRDTSPIIALAPDEASFDVRFDCGYGGSQGPHVLAWSEARVYFPVEHGLSRRPPVEPRAATMDTPMTLLERDPHYDWHEVGTLDGSPMWVRGQCRHLDVVPVESGGDVVAHLCRTCDEQLP